MTSFKNGNIYTEEFHFVRGNLSIENGKFVNVLGHASNDAIDLKGKKIIPGLIDIHTHGNSGYDFSEVTYEGLKESSRYYARNGITSFAPTSLTVPFEQLQNAYRIARQVHEDNEEGLSHIRGINMEGPFFNPNRKGAQNAAHLQLPNYEAFKKLNDASGDLIKIVDIAPELDGSMEFIKKVSKQITVSVAHTDCTYEDALKAFDSGASQLTHLFNAMPGIHHRKPGPIIAAYEKNNVMLEIIGDGHHIHPAIIRFAFKIFGAERMILVSDSLRCCGMPDGTFNLGGLTAYISNGVAKLDDGTLAGSMTNLYECLKRVIAFGISEEDAIRAATYNPAKQLDCLSETGSIRDGKNADFLILSESLDLESVYIDGKKI